MCRTHITVNATIIFNCIQTVAPYFSRECHVAACDAIIAVYIYYKTHPDMCEPGQRPLYHSINERTNSAHLYIKCQVPP